LAGILNGAPVIQAGQIYFIVYKFATTQTGGNIKFNLNTSQGKPVNFDEGV
jgi:hypothetical protein